jgi:hypothetical protein
MKVKEPKYLIDEKVVFRLKECPEVAYQGKIVSASFFEEKWSYEIVGFPLLGEEDILYKLF